MDLMNYRNMLAAAHVLAMDAKNLLDVVDCIRERHPNIDWQAALNPYTSQPVSPQSQTAPTENLASQNQAFTFQNQSYAADEAFAGEASSQDEIPPKPDFRINQPVTTGQLNIMEHLPKEHSSLPATSNRVSALIHNYNLYGNVREPQHIYGNADSGIALQRSTSSVEESKVDVAPIESVKSRIQAIAGKIDSPPIYAISKKAIPLEPVGHNDQG